MTYSLCNFEQGPAARAACRQPSSDSRRWGGSPGRGLVVRSWSARCGCWSWTTAKTRPSRSACAGTTPAGPTPVVVPSPCSCRNLSLRCRRSSFLSGRVLSQSSNRGFALEPTKVPSFVAGVGVSLRSLSSGISRHREPETPDSTSGSGVYHSGTDSPMFGQSPSGLPRTGGSKRSV